MEFPFEIKCFGTRQKWRLFNIMNAQKCTELFTLKWLILVVVKGAGRGGKIGKLGVRRDKLIYTGWINKVLLCIVQRPIFNIL